MEVKITRKIVLTYKPRNESKSQNIEMKFMKNSGSKTGGIYGEHIKLICDTLNKAIKKLVDDAQFHIVEITIIK